MAKTVGNSTTPSSRFYPLRVLLRHVPLRFVCLAAGSVLLTACPERVSQKPPASSGGAGAEPAPAKPEQPPPWKRQPSLEPHQVYALADGAGEVIDAEAAAARGLVRVDLSDAWAPFIFSERSGDEEEAKPQPYRQIFLQLANDEVDPDVLYLRGDGPTKGIPSVPQGLTPRQREAYDEQRETQRQKDLKRLMARPVNNFLEPYGIPPTLSVLRKRIAEDEVRAACFDEVDHEAFRAFSGSLVYQDMALARREHQQALDDAAWVQQEIEAYRQAVATAALAPPDGGDELAALAADPAKAPRIQRYHAGQARQRAVRAAQQRLVCEGLIRPGDKFSEGVFDLITHEALAEFERKNDIFSWGILGGETLAALARSPLELHLETFKRIVTERIVDSASIIEDESVAQLGKLARYKDQEGQERVVENLVGKYRDAMLAAMGIGSGEDVAELLRTVDTGSFVVAFEAPPRPPYYAESMQLEVEIDRGDIWYDFPFDDAGKPLPQPRHQYPHLTLFVRWADQKIPLARWRTTIGSWRSERHPDGNVYYKYKNSDVGPRIWKHIVVSPVWVPPDGTPPGDMLTRKKFNPHAKPEVVVNTDVVGPGFQSAYGLVMAIHHQVTPGGGLFDNQIRTHGSVDYTSIARRYSHGCHRLVNIRAVRLFGFVLKHTPFERMGDQKLGIRKRFSHEGRTHEYLLGSRGYYYRLERPLKVEVLEGRIMGRVQDPIVAFVRKPGMNEAGARADEGADVAELGPAPGETALDPPGDEGGGNEGAQNGAVAEGEPGAKTPDGIGPDTTAATVLPPVISPAEARARGGGGKARR